MTEEVFIYLLTFATCRIFSPSLQTLDGFPCGATHERQTPNKANADKRQRLLGLVSVGGCFIFLYQSLQTVNYTLSKAF